MELKEGYIICYQYQVLLTGYDKYLGKLVPVYVTVFKNPFNPIVSNLKPESYKKIVGWRIKKIKQQDD